MICSQIMQVLLLFLFISTTGFSAETCSRTAIIGDQHILVDLNSSQKGEGLRHYLEKDPEALSHLEKYRNAQELSITNATLGSLGATSTILGLTLDVPDKTKNLMITAGLTTLLINYLVAKTRQVSNEKNLQRAINIYNQKHLPLIQIIPEGKETFSDGVSINYQGSF